MTFTEAVMSFVLTSICARLRGRSETPVASPAGGALRLATVPQRPRQNGGYGVTTRLSTTVCACRLREVLRDARITHYGLLNHILLNRVSGAAVDRLRAVTSGHEIAGVDERLAIVAGINSLLASRPRSPRVTFRYEDIWATAPAYCSCNFRRLLDGAGLRVVDVADALGRRSSYVSELRRGVCRPTESELAIVERLAASRGLRSIPSRESTEVVVQ